MLRSKVADKLNEVCFSYHCHQQLLSVPCSSQQANQWSPLQRMDQWSEGGRDNKNSAMALSFIHAVSKFYVFEQSSAKEQICVETIMLVRDGMTDGECENTQLCVGLFLPLHGPPAWSPVV